FDGALLKDGRSTRAAGILWNGGKAFLKRYHRPGLIHRLKYLARRSPALRSWVTGYALELHSVPAARPLAVLEVRKRGWPVVSYLVTEWVDGSTSDCLFADPGRTPELRAVASALAAALARAQSRGIRYRDLKPRNVSVP